MANKSPFLLQLLSFLGGISNAILSGGFQSHNTRRGQPFNLHFATGVQHLQSPSFMYSFYLTEPSLLVISGNLVNRKKEQRNTDLI